MLAAVTWSSGRPCAHVFDVVGPRLFSSGWTPHMAVGPLLGFRPCRVESAPGAVLFLVMWRVRLPWVCDVGRVCLVAVVCGLFIFVYSGEFADGHHLVLSMHV